MKVKIKPFKIIAILLVVMIGLYCYQRISAIEYPFIYEGKSKSKSFELVKISERTPKGVLFNKEQNQYIILTQDKMYKLNSKGVVIDTFKEFVRPHPSGLILNKATFNDWILTGYKSNKNYSQDLDARGFTLEALFKLFDTADIVEFYSPTYKKAYAYLYTDGAIQRIDISDKYKFIEKHNSKYHPIQWSGYYFDGYEHSNTNLAFLNRFEFDNANEHLYNEKFVKLLPLWAFTGLEEGIMSTIEFIFLIFLGLLGAPFTHAPSFDFPLNEPGILWYGYDCIDIIHKSETIKFKFPTTGFNNHTSREHYSAYTLNNISSSPIKFITVKSQDSFNHQNSIFDRQPDKKSVGIYIIREKSISNNDILSPRKNGWRIKYSDSPFLKSASGIILFYNPKTEAKSYEFNTINEIRYKHYQQPRSIGIEWTHNIKYDVFKIQDQTGKLFFFYQKKTTDTELMWIEFDEKKLRENFSEISRDNNENFNINIHFDKINNNTINLIVSLSNKKKRIEITDYTIRVTTSNTSKRSVYLRQLKNQFNFAKRDTGSLDKLLKQAMFLLEGEDRKDYIPHLTAYLTELLNEHYVPQHRFEDASKIARFSANTLFPIIHQTTSEKKILYLTTVIASQSLAAASLGKLPDIQSLVIDRMLGNNFNIETTPNSTLVYNLACTYAITGQKEKLLQATKRARELGKPTSQFLKDVDFINYLEDKDFINTLKKH